VVSNGTMTDHCWSGCDLKLRARDPIGVISRHLSGGAQNNRKNPQSIGSMNCHSSVKCHRKNLNFSKFSCGSYVPGLPFMRFYTLWFLRGTLKILIRNTGLWTLKLLERQIDNVIHVAAKRWLFNKNLESYIDWNMFVFVFKLSLCSKCNLFLFG